MKKMFLWIVTVLLCLAGCTEENGLNEQGMNGRIQASFEKSATSSRLLVGESNVLTWSTGDSFLMFNDDNESSAWELEGTGGQEMGTFVGTELGGVLKGAAFPSSAQPSLSGEELTMTLPSEIAYEKGICNLPMWASFSSLDDIVSFKHLGALLKIDFKDIPANYNTLIVSADKAVSGTFSVDLSESEPVLQATENGVNSVTVSFTANSDDKKDRLFYLPLPVGEYGFINVSISDGTNTKSVADWKNRTIVRKKVYLASLTYRVSDAETSLEVSDELSDMIASNANATIELTQKIDATSGAIVLPAEALKVGLSFNEVPTTAEATPLIIEEEEATTNAQLNISIPFSESAYVKFDTPTTTVNVESGNFMKMNARTAANTLVLGKNTTVTDLVVLGGNVVLDGGKIIGSITRDASNTDEVTYVYVESKKELTGVAIGEGIKVSDNPKADYVTFSANAEQTLTMSKSVATLEYSVNGGRWTELGTTTVTFGGENGNLRLRGKSAEGTAAGYITMGNNELPTACTGNILTLVDYENYEDETLDTSNAIFKNLFFGCNSLTSAPKLPAMNLAAQCYYQMFVYCYALEKAPELPAATLSKKCYQSMFYQCTSLEVAPELPATTLADSCYIQMFTGCTKLKEAPGKLPATTLTTACYANMFKNCTSLVEAPELQATTMANYSCFHMFDNCTSLTLAPKLPATTLAYSCYHSMFYNCTSLTSAPELPATELANTCYVQMFMNCTSLQEAPELPATIMVPQCYMNLFWGCKSLKKAPELPATTLANACYMQMFVECTGLTKAPKLPVTALAPYCYQSMFSDSGLTEAPELPATTLANGCYSGMFNRCSGLTKAPELPATTLANGCYSGMFSYCSNLIGVPQLPATTLANGCYTSMFSYCTSLTSAPELPVTTLAVGCYRMMFMGCTNLTVAPKLPATTMAERCYQMMFWKCSKLNNVTMLATDITANKCLDMWLDGVASEGTFYKNSSVSDVSGYGIPETWEVK